MTRIPLVAGARIVVVSAPENAVVLAPPPPGAGIVDVGAAVRDSLRFPLAGPPLEQVVPRGGRVTVVVEPPALPVVAAERDPRQAAIEATVAELERLSVPSERITLLVAGGLARRLGGRELEALVSPTFARGFHGRVEVHDAESPELVEIGLDGGLPLRVHPALVDADALVTVTAAETVLHGGPAALLSAGSPELLRAAQAASLVETSGSRGWSLALAVERALASRLPAVGVSLSIESPRLVGALRGFPYEPEAVRRLARPGLRFPFGLLPRPLQTRLLRTGPLGLTAAAVFVGPPSVAHAETLLRGVEARAAPLDGPLDALCIGIPSTTPYLPREPPNPLLAAALGLSLALRLWRERPPIVEGGSVILLHHFRRHFSHPTQQPYRTFFAATRFGREPEQLAAAELAAATDRQALELYRSGRTCHPLLPFSDWAACQPALGRLGSVLVAGCRDAVAARQLGFVPTHGVNAALALAKGRAGERPRIGFLLSPPYFPLRVAEG